jgi:hypothetical protein
VINGQRQSHIEQGPAHVPEGAQGAGRVRPTRRTRPTGCDPPLCIDVPESRDATWRASRATGRTS